jgi:hypothetical protein
MKDYTAYAKKDISPTMAAFAEWLTKETGVTVDELSVALAGSLRSDFQKSDFWRDHPSNPRTNAAAKKAERAQAQLDAAKKAQERANERVKAAQKALADSKADSKAESTSNAA